MNQRTALTPFPSDVTRREFLKAGSIAAAALATPLATVQGTQQNTVGTARLNLAFVGVGGRGGDNLGELAKLPDVRVAALCDVDSRALADAAGKYGVAETSTYRDFRELFEKESRRIDAVVVSTPDHTHAPATMLALKAGKHVYCEKPLTRTIHEAREITKAARAAGVATQMGNQGMAFDGNRVIKELLADDALGTVREVHVWSDRPTHAGKTPLWWPQGVELPTDTRPAPAHLDWNLWLGPAPERPFHPDYGPFVWRGWWDYGNGGLGDMGIHNLAPVFDALHLDAPTTVQACSTPVFPESIPVASIVHYQFPARDGRAPVQLHWYDGGMTPARPADLDDDLPMPREDGIIFEGTKGTMLVNGWGGEMPMLLPRRRDREYPRPAPTLPRSIGHYAEWIEACRTGAKTASNFDFAGPLTEAILVGSVCIRLGGEKLQWDSANLKFVDHPQANSLVHYQYREGWSL